MQKMNIFLTGQIQIGKSTVLNKVLSLLEYKKAAKFGGFSTFHISECRDVFIAAFGEEKIIDDAHKIATWQNNCMQPHDDVFNQLGKNILQNSKSADFIIMDELGYLEKNAESFKQEVFQCLQSNIPCIGILRKANIAWHQPIYQDDNTKIIEVTSANRNGLPYEVYDLLTKSN
jgi:nucleoside-triphosphatase